MTFSSRLMKRRWAGVESYFPLHRVRKWCFRHLWVQSGIPICLLEIGNGGTTRHGASREPVAHRQRGSGRNATCDCVHHWSSQCSTGPLCVSTKVLPVKHRCPAMICFQISLIMAYHTDLWHIYCNMSIIYIQESTLQFLKSCINALTSDTVVLKVGYTVWSRFFLFFCDSHRNHNPSLSALISIPVLLASCIE